MFSCNHIHIIMAWNKKHNYLLQKKLPQEGLYLALSKTGSGDNIWTVGRHYTILRGWSVLRAGRSDEILRESLALFSRKSLCFNRPLFQSTRISPTIKMSTNTDEELIHKKGATSVVWKWFGYKQSDIEQTVLCKVCRKSNAFYKFFRDGLQDHFFSVWFKKIFAQ